MKRIYWLGVTLIAFCLALAGSWLLLAAFNFGYDYLYTLIDIPAHIAQYGPVYIERADFVVTTDQERSRLFAEVVTAIHNHGEGLATLSYYSPDGERLNTAFNHDEVVHLQDVAILIDRVTCAVVVMLGVFVLLLAYLYVTGQPMPPFKSLFAYVMVALVIGTLVVFAIGPYEVFYQMHVWVFPEEHKWKFYYEESVMSNLMKAPDLFAYIAVMLVVLSIPLFALIMGLVKQLFRLRTPRHV
ncbi:DUF1461 domain-containing protein [Leucothrix sargassi]|nr:DUF1461 domain-containing protein [Leucothrix sargassi]